MLIDFVEFLSSSSDAESDVAITDDDATTDETHNETNHDLLKKRNMLSNFKKCNTQKKSETLASIHQLNTQ